MLSLLLFSCGRSRDFSLTRESNSLSDYRRVRLLSLEPRVLLYFTQNFPFRYWDYDFSLENKDPAECTTDFRFEKSDSSLLVDVWLIVVQSFFFFWLLFRGTNAWCENAGHIWPLCWPGTVRLFPCWTGDLMCIYGDPAYPLRTHLQCPFRHGVLTRQMEEFNASMSSVLQVKFLDYKKNPQNWP